MQLTAAVAQNYSGSLNRDVIGDIAKDLYHELTQILQLADSGKTSEAVSRLRQLLAVKEGPSYSPEQLAYYKEIKTQEENKRVADERQKQMLITKVAKLGAGNRRSEVK